MITVEQAHVFEDCHKSRVARTQEMIATNPKQIALR